MGKVLSNFEPGWPGAVSRSADDIIVPMANRESTEAIAFGAPVVMASDHKGVINWTSTSDEDDFVGVAVRGASKTPDTYGGNLANYPAKSMVDVITRGSVIIRVMGGSPYSGGPVYIVKASGAFTAVDDSPNTVELKNVFFRGERNSAGDVEAVITERNIL